MLTKENINKIIEEIINEIDDFKINSINLKKFTNSKIDQMYLSYLNGTGGKYIKFLALLTKKMEFKNIVELGNREGLSTLAIYNSLPSTSQFTTIDIIKDLRYCPDEMFKDNRVNILYGDVLSTSIIEKIPQKIDFLFSDTIHFFEQINNEFETYKYLLNEYALVAIDDIHLNDKGIFWDKIQFPKWNLTDLCHKSGWGLFLYHNPEYNKENNLFKSIYTTSILWEQRFKNLEKERESIQNKKFFIKIKNLIKQKKFIYNKYTSIYNKINQYIKKI